MSMNMNLMIKVGPAGGIGTVWDEMGKGEIAKIFVSYDKFAIQSLQFLFVENGNFVLSDRHGHTAHDANFTTVVLDHPSEFLTCIRGSYDVETSRRIYLRSITFGTNNDNTYGPYGILKTTFDLKLKEFNFYIGDDRSFGGFYGTKHGNYIESIGVYLKTITSSIINTPKSSRGKVKKEERTLKF